MTTRNFSFVQVKLTKKGFGYMYWKYSLLCCLLFCSLPEFWMKTTLILFMFYFKKSSLTFSRTFLFHVSQVCDLPGTVTREPGFTRRSGKILGTFLRQHYFYCHHPRLSTCSLISLRPSQPLSNHRNLKASATFFSPHPINLHLWLPPYLI